MRRLVVGLLAAAIGLASTSAPVLASVAPAVRAPDLVLAAEVAATKAVTWEVDEEAKVITVTVRMTFATSCTSATIKRLTKKGPAFAAKCKVSDKAVQAIKANITKIWNNGNKYRCYVLRVVVDVKVDNRPTDKRPPPKADDRVQVVIDQTSGNITSAVQVNRNSGSTWDGSTPNDRLTPVNGRVPPTTWSYPPARWKKSLYAHEAAHVMGLGDTYETYVDPADGKEYSRPKAGAPDDVLSNIAKTNVDQKTVDRLVERGDAFKGGKPKCDYKIDIMVDWYHFTSTKCGGPEGDWLITLTGTLPLGGAELALTGTGHATLARTAQTAKDKSFTGPWNAAFRVDVVGVPLSSGGQQGTSSGDATLKKAVLHLVGKTAQGDFWSYNPYAAITGPTDPLKSFDLPVTNGAFCP